MSRYYVRTPGGAAFGPADEPMLVQWAREGRVPSAARIVPENDPDSPGVAASEHPAIRGVLTAPPTVGAVGATPPPEASDATGGLIPYKNPLALAGYYVSISALIPGVGAIAGPVAFGMGIAGLRARAREPFRRGAVHAWIAIVLGGLCTLANWGAVVLAIVTR